LFEKKKKKKKSEEVFFFGECGKRVLRRDASQHCKTHTGIVRKRRASRRLQRIRTGGSGRNMRVVDAAIGLLLRQNIIHGTNCTAKRKKREKKNEEDEEVNGEIAAERRRQTHAMRVSWSGKAETYRMTSSVLPWFAIAAKRKIIASVSVASFVPPTAAPPPPSPLLIDE
jgi:hypothetical protein